MLQIPTLPSRERTVGSADIAGPPSWVVAGLLDRHCHAHASASGKKAVNGPGGGPPHRPRACPPPSRGSSDLVHAAVGVQFGAGGEAALVRGEEQHGARDLV